ncbi:MAG: tetratricopeptide repeat protein [Planctomycetes bacterium]|nr:tetratricopeptide repeat protein [Planctomycetota bacterium]
MKTFTCLFLLIALLAPTLSGGETGRRNKRRLKRLEEYNVDTPEKLLKLAKDNTKNGNYGVALNQYNVLVRWFPELKLGQKVLILIAGIYYESGQPKKALEIIEEYGEDYPDSFEITRLVDLAFEVGKQYIVAKDANYQSINRYSKAIRAFEFVVTHDPYSLKASEGLLSTAIIHMKRSNWEEALVALKSIGRKQPGSAISADAEVLIAECFLGMNKGANYDGESLENSQRYLEGYLSEFPMGLQRKKAEKLLQETHLRFGRKHLESARLYCTARKWDAAKLYLEDILAKPELQFAHSEASALLKRVKEEL